MSPDSHGGARPRLLVLASTYPRRRDDHEPGFVHELARRMVPAFDVTVICPHAPGALRRETMDGVQVERYRYAPASWERLVNDGGIVSNLRRHRWMYLLVPGFVLGLAWAAWRHLRTHGADVIHAHWLLPQGCVVAMLGMLKRRFPPFLVTSHGADVFALRAPPLQAVKRFVARRAAALTVVSAAMRSEMQRWGVDGERIAVEPMGVDLRERFVPDPRIGRSHDELLFVGRLVEKKGLHHLLDAMPHIVAARPDVRLTVAGFGPDLDARIAQAERLGLSSKIDFVGPVEQGALPDLYRRAALFVAPFVEAADGDAEGLGLVSIEAAGCGCPLVLGDVAAVRGALGDIPGIRLVTANDPVALACACVELLQSGSAPAAMRDELVRRFDWQARAEAYRTRLMDLIRRAEAPSDAP